MQISFYVGAIRTTTMGFVSTSVVLLKARSLFAQIIRMVVRREIHFIRTPFGPSLSLVRLVIVDTINLGNIYLQI